MPIRACTESLSASLHRPHLHARSHALTLVYDPRLLLQLRQLARDRFTTLPSQWKAMIMHYALWILKYQQSIRLLGLSSRQKYEELVREIEAVCDGMKEWNPDWLLIQVGLPS